MTTTVKPRTSDRIREEVAFVLDLFDRLGIDPGHVTSGHYLSAHISGYQRTDEAIAEVDRIAEALNLSPDDGETANYDRRGPVTISGRRVEFAVYTGRPRTIEAQS